MGYLATIAIGIEIHYLSFDKEDSSQLDLLINQAKLQQDS